MRNVFPTDRHFLLRMLYLRTHYRYIDGYEGAIKPYKTKPQNEEWGIERSGTAFKTERHRSKMHGRGDPAPQRHRAPRQNPAQGEPGQERRPDRGPGIARRVPVQSKRNAAPPCAR